MCMMIFEKARCVYVTLSLTSSVTEILSTRIKGQRYII